MLKNYVSVTSVYWHQEGTFLGGLWDVTSSAIDLKNWHGFSTLVKNEKGDVAIDN